MEELKEKLWPLAKEYARQVGEVIDLEPEDWVGEDISCDICCYGDTIFLTLEDMQVIIDHLPKWIENYGSKEAVGQEIRDWLCWIFDDAYDADENKYRHHVRINLYNWLSGLRPNMLKRTIADDIEQTKEQIAAVKSLIKEYRGARSLDNVLTNLEAHLKELEAKAEKEREKEMIDLKQTDAYKRFEADVKEAMRTGEF